MFLNYINNFRGIAIIYIVAGHCLSVFNWDESPQLIRLLKLLLSNGTVFFVFIAGYLFQYLLYKYEMKTYFIAKLKYVLIPYFVASLPAIIYLIISVQIQEQYPFYKWTSIEWYVLHIPDNFQNIPILYFFATGIHLGPLWFIPMITVFYLISPLLAALDKNKWFYSILPLTIVVSCIFFRDNDYLYTIFFKLSPFSSVYLSIHFFSVYLLGMFFSRYRNTINPILLNSVILTTLFFAYFPLVGAEFYLMGEKTMSFLNLLRKLILCAIFIGLLLRLEGKFNMKILTVLAETSFGIFFIHAYFISAFTRLELKILNERLSGNIFLLLIFIVFVLLLSAGIVLLARKLFGKHSRFLLGS